jgi:hypothetical protein
MTNQDKPKNLKLKGDWGKAMGKAMKKKRPAGGWPKVPEA